MSKIITYVLGAIILVPTLIALYVYEVFSWGFVCLKLYNWFVLPLGIQGLPVLNLVQMMGIYVFLKAIGYHSNTHLKDEYKDKPSLYGAVILGPWLILLFAYSLRLIVF